MVVRVRVPSRVQQYWNQFSNAKITRREKSTSLLTKQPKALIDRQLTLKVYFKRW